MIRPSMQHRRGTGRAARNPRRTPRRSIACATILLLVQVGSSGAVVVSTPDDRANARAPDFGLPWLHVGRRDQYSAVYLGNRWVLTAAHVGAFPVRFGGREYAPQARSAQRLLNPDGSPSDLIAFRLEGTAPEASRHDAPALPLLPIARRSPPPGTPVWLVGQGYDRGRETTWTSREGRRHVGFEGASTRTMRWGTNRLESAPENAVVNGIKTRVLATRFSAPNDPTATRYEAQATVGDSGGALFVLENGRFALAGILILREQDSRQPKTLTLYGNRTLSADLAHYRDQLVALVRPDCADEIDNDGDGRTDFPNDPECRRPADDSEAGSLGSPAP